MPYQVTITAREFHFNFLARTSRGSMNSRRCWFIDISAQGVPGRHGTGEAAPLEGLSEEGEERVLRDLLRLKDWLESMDASMPEDLLSAGQIGERLDLCSSVRFAFEMAAMEMASGRKGRYFDCPLNSGIPVPVNGLIWMAEIAEMKEQAKDKALQGFQCIKFKVGGQRFEEECAMLEWVRGSEWGKTLEIRLDANGAFGPADVMEKLHRLAAFRIQSIEQPVRSGNMALMKEVCIESPIPVALDEELIGVRGADKERLLAEIRPAFIVLKPSLHGGFSGAFEWLRVAKGSGIGWWLTSSLESPQGLAALSQFTSSLNPVIAQGLGTGRIYSDAGDGCVEVREGRLFLL